jgi:hypothetical protein
VGQSKSPLLARPVRMLGSVLGVRDALSTLVPYVHRKLEKSNSKHSKDDFTANEEEEVGDGQGSERGDVLVSEKLVEVSYLLAHIEDVFLRCSRERNTSDGPWVFLCYVLTLFGHRIGDVFPLQELLHSISIKHSLCSPKEKFRILLRIVLQNKQLDGFLSILALLTATMDNIDICDSEYGKLCLGFYTYDSILMSRVFMNLILKVTLFARVVPFELNTTSGMPFLTENFDDDEDDKEDTGSRNLQSIRLGRTDATTTFSQLEVSLDPGLVRRRDSEDRMSGGKASVFAAVATDDAERESASLTTRAQMKFAANETEPEHFSTVSKNLLILETLAIHLLDAATNLQDPMVKGLLVRQSYKPDVREESFYKEEDYSGHEEVKWVREQIDHERFAFSIPAEISKQALFQGLMESLLDLPTPLIGDNELFHSLLLVMDIKQTEARVRNVALLIAQAPRPTFPLLAALLRLFDRLVAGSALSLTAASVILCPLFFSSPAKHAYRKTYFDAESLTYLVFSRAHPESTPYSEFLKSYAQNPRQNSWASFLIEFLLLNVPEILSICENNM